MFDVCVLKSYAEIRVQTKKVVSARLHGTLLSLRCDCAALLSARSSLVAQARIRSFSAHFELLKRHLCLAESRLRPKKWPITGVGRRSSAGPKPYTQVVGYEGGGARPPKVMGSARKVAERGRRSLRSSGNPQRALSGNRLRRIKLDLARRHNAFPNALVHPLQ